MSDRRGTGVLVAIALFKVVKAILLIAVGVGALSLVHDPHTAATLRHAVNALRMDPNNRFFNRAVSAVSGLDDKKLEEVGIGTFVYATVFLVEGTGLLLRKRWAEYLTTIVTASFIPFEIYELVHNPSALKVAGLVANVLIVVYLGVRLWKERRSSKH
jgi:uncharacterized membrane protein (DUF2068 family)